MFGGGHATTFTDALFAFDFQTLTWKELWAPTPCTTTGMGSGNFDRTNGAWRSGTSGPYPRPISRHTYDLTVYLDTLDEFAILVGPNGDSGSCPPGSSGYDFANLGAHTAHYSFTSGNWQFSATATGDGHPEYTSGEYAAAELDPPSGKVVILGQYGAYVYDPVTRTKTVALDDYNDNAFGNADLGYANELVYFPPNQKHYYFDRGTGNVWELTLDRSDFTRSTLARVTATGPAPSGSETGYAYDAVNRVIGGGVADNRFYVFDPALKSWQSLADPGSRARLASLPRDRLRSGGRGVRLRHRRSPHVRLSLQVICPRSIFRRRGSDSRARLFRRGILAATKTHLVTEVLFVVPFCHGSAAISHRPPPTTFQRRAVRRLFPG